MWTKTNILSAVSVCNAFFNIVMLIISLFTNIDLNIEYGPIDYASINISFNKT